MHIYYPLIPLIIAIVGAAVTKRIIPSLVGGLLIGTLIKSGSLLGMIMLAGNYLSGVFTDRNNAYIILFLFCFGALAEIFKVGGGISGFAKIAEPYARSERGALLSVWAATPISFLDCCFHVIATTTITKPLLKEANSSKEKAAFIINTTSSQLIVLIPFATTYVGYILGLITSSMARAGFTGSAFMVYFSGIFLNFYSIAILLISILVIFINFDLSKAFFKILQPAFKMEVTDKGETIGEHDTEEAYEQGEYDEKASPRIRNLLIPLGFLIALITYLLWWTGRKNGAGFFQAITNADYEKAIFIATLATLVVTGILYAVQKIPLKNIESSFLTGGRDLLPPIVILILAWSITDVTRDLGFTKLIGSLIKTSFPHQLVPLIIFIIGGLASYFMGSSWGTWALIMPVAFSMAATTGASIPLTVGAVLAGGSIGDNISPLGETPVTTASIMGISVTRHVDYVLPFGIIAIVISLALYLSLGYLIS